jgi:hypothetical protein
MTPPLSKVQIETLQKVFYEDGFIFGRDKLFKYFESKYPDLKLSRRQIADWLSLQEINQLHQQHEKPKDIKSTILSKPHLQIGIDLIDLQNFEKNGYKYLLNAVDLFSRKIYSEPLKNKEEKTVLTAFKKIVKKVPNIKSTRSDRGSEFIAKIFTDYLQKENIHQVLSKAHTPQSNGGIERANQTIKRLIHKNIEMKNDFDWVKKIGSITDNMNNTIIDKINKTPNQIEKEYDDNDLEALEKTQELDKKKKKSIGTQKYIIGDNVRIYQPSEKMKSRNWSEDVYKVKKIFKPKTEYGIFEYKLNEFNQRFKTEDLLKIPKQTQNQIEKLELYEISKIVKPVVRNNSEHYEVAWKNYQGKNTLEPLDELIKDIPKMINLYNKRNNVIWKKDKKGNMKFTFKDKNKEKEK